MFSKQSQIELGFFCTYTRQPSSTQAPTNQAHPARWRTPPNPPTSMQPQEARGREKEREKHKISGDNFSPRRIHPISNTEGPHRTILVHHCHPLACGRIQGVKHRLTKRHSLKSESHVPCKDPWFINSHQWHKETDMQKVSIKNPN